MELFLLLAFAGSVAALNIDGPDQDADDPEDVPETETPQPPLDTTGISGTDDALNGSAGNDTLTGNAGDQDTLQGGEGDDLLNLGAGNSAEGGAGTDRFVLNDAGSRETVIEDFELGSDALAVTPYSDELELIQTDGGLALIDTLNQRTVLTLPSVALADGEALEVDLLLGNGDVYRTLSFDSARISAPFALDAIRGTSGADALTGTGGDDMIFGERVADTLSGGAGDNSSFSGRGSIYVPGSCHHFPGSLTNAGDDGDVLDGSSGNDHLWIGPGTTASGADSFHAFANVYDAGAPAAEITDFDPAEDKLLIDFPVVAAFGTTPSFSFKDAIAGLSVTYDADQDSTLIAMDGVAIAALSGHQPQAGIAFHDDYPTDENRWRDAAGNPISDEDGAAASIILAAQQDRSVLGVNYDATPA